MIEYQDSRPKGRLLYIYARFNSNSCIKQKIYENNSGNVAKNIDKKVTEWYNYSKLFDIADKAFCRFCHKPQ